MSGSVIHAQMTSQILSTVLDGQPLIWDWPQWGEWLWILGWSLFGGIFTSKLKRPIWLGLGVTLGLSSLLGITWLVFNQSGWIPLVPPAIAFVATSVSVIAYDRSTVHQSKSQDSSLRSSERSIFISYRRSDSRHVTRKIYDLLAAYFGHERVFRDLDSIPPGETFKEYIEHELHQCQILIAVIGSTWLESTDRNGHRRLDNPNDWVRLEIEFALNRGIRVIPLLINDAKMPQADELPGLLKDLHTRNAVRMRHAFGLNRRDIGRLIGNCEILLSDTYEK